MKDMIRTLSHRLVLLFTTLCLSVLAFAQDKGLDVDVNVNKNNQWYQQPWVWIVGVAVFVLLLAAIMRGGRKE